MLRKEYTIFLLCEMEGETVYGSQEDSQSVMSERVQTLARNIYQEFQRMIQRYDEDVVKVIDSSLYTVDC